MSYEIAIVIGLAAISFVLAYLSMNLNKEEHGALQVFFASLSLFFLWAVLSSVQVIMEIYSITAFLPLLLSMTNILIWGGIFFIFYNFVIFVRNIFLNLQIKKRRKSENPFGKTGGLSGNG